MGIGVNKPIPNPVFGHIALIEYPKCVTATS